VQFERRTEVCAHGRASSDPTPRKPGNAGGGKEPWFRGANDLRPPRLSPTLPKLSRPFLASSGTRDEDARGEIERFRLGSQLIPNEGLYDR